MISLFLFYVYECLHVCALGAWLEPLMPERWIQIPLMELQMIVSSHVVDGTLPNRLPSKSTGAS